MDWLSLMMKALDYIEDNLGEKIDINQAAKEAASSPFHFQRLFSMVTGVTVMEYLRRRRLTVAAQELAMDSSVKVIDVAMKYGYETPEAFTKAFKRFYGLTPTEVRKTGTRLRAYPRITFSLSLKGDVPMDYRLVERPGFKVVGKGIRLSTKGADNYKIIPDFWTQCNNDGTTDTLCQLAASNETLGICTDMDFATEEFIYMVAVMYTSDKEVPKGLEIQEIPAAHWAVFTSKGPIPKAIQDVTTRIFQEWFPSTGYEHADGPELEIYPMGDMTSTDYQCEVWIPIVKK